nr:uncharacterized protein LOC113694346 [Coffea arabica]
MAVVVGTDGGGGLGWGRKKEKREGNFLWCVLGPVYGITQQLSPSTSTPPYTGQHLFIRPAASPSGSSQKEHAFPERPGQPECQCHHPAECSAQKANLVLGPKGLHLLRGVAVCCHYFQNGVCKFDHPMRSLSYSQSASSLPDMPVAPYPVVMDDSIKFANGSKENMISDENTTNMISSDIKGGDQEGDSASLSSQSSSNYLEKLMDASRSNENVLPQNALQTLLRRREELLLQLSIVQKKIALCDKIIQTIMKAYKDSIYLSIPPAAGPSDIITNLNGVHKRQILSLAPGVYLSVRVLAVCHHYLQNEVCKFGCSGMFDHPMGSLSYSPSASSLADVPVAPYAVGSSMGTLAPSSSSLDLRPKLILSSSKDAFSS